MSRTPYLDAHYETRTWEEISKEEELRLRRLPESEQIPLETYNIDSGRAIQRDKWYSVMGPSSQRLLDRRDDVIWDLELLGCDPELIGCGGYAKRTDKGLLLTIYAGTHPRPDIRYFLARGQR